ncbi:MAG: hypothetical protein WCI56_13745 [Hyphomicrobiales bacterium]
MTSLESRKLKTVRRLAVAAALLFPVCAHAAEPVKQIVIEVQPFYRAARTANEAPQVGTGRPHAEKLASTKRNDILAVRDMIITDPKTVSPMTMMVLAIRLYDVGLRDDAVFWFYAAKDRFIALTEVALPNTPLLVQSNEAMSNFNTLAGAAINGYAFCNIAKQKEQRAKALAWVEANPYDAVFNEKIPARTSDRKAALVKAIENAKANAAKERAYLDDPKNLEAFNAGRKKNEMDSKFCWG